MSEVTITANLIGLSTETKPLDVPEGSTYLEVDTKDVYILHNGVWYKQ